MPSTRLELACFLLERCALGAVADQDQSGVDAPVPQLPDRPQDVLGLLHGRHPGDPADAEALGRDAEGSANRRSVGGARHALGELDSEANDGEPGGGRHSHLDQLVTDLGAHGDEGVCAAREVSLDRPERVCAKGVELPLQHVSVERVDDDRRPCAARKACCGAPDGAGLRGVRVENMRPVTPDQVAEALHGRSILERRDLSLEPRDRLDLYPPLLGDERHRCLAFGDRPCREGGRIPALGETLAEVGDVQRGTADVESCDHAQNADRIVGGSQHGCERYRVWARERTLRRCPY